MNQKPALVIAVQNESTLLRQKLPQFLKLFVEIVVINNGSSDDSSLVLKQFPVMAIDIPSGEIKTRGECWNIGATHCQAPSILFWPIDVEISPAALLAWERAWQSANVDYSCFKIRFPNARFHFRCLEKISNFRSRYLRIVYLDQGLCVTKKIFTRIGGFPHKPLLEDLEISLRLRNFKFAFIPAEIQPSIRKFEKNGFYRYLWRMNITLALRLFGFPPAAIHQYYYAK